MVTLNENLFRYSKPVSYAEDQSLSSPPRKEYSGFFGKVGDYLSNKVIAMQKRSRDFFHKTPDNNPTALQKVFLILSRFPYISSRKPTKQSAWDIIALNTTSSLFLK
jgi:hypothetical protein